MFRVTYFILSFFVLANASAAPTFADKVPSELKETNQKFISVAVENDTLGSDNDDNYTSGVRLAYEDVNLKTPQFVTEVIERALPFTEVSANTAVSYSIGQNMFTPSEGQRTPPDPTDRPYAAFLYGSIGLSTLVDNHVDEIELTVGVVGPAALGEPLQNAVHNFWGVRTPEGWDYQLDTELGINLLFQRQWPEVLAADFAGLHLRTSPHAGLAVGNIYTYANTGVTVSLMPQRAKWQATQLRVRPSIPGSGYFYVPEGEWAWSVFAGVEGRAVGRNIFLDGNTFGDSPSVDKKNIVADANVGFSVSYGNIKTAYTLNYRTKEFYAQDKSTMFGAISISYRF